MAVNNEINSSSLGIRLSSVMETYSTRTSVVKLGIDVLEQLISLRDGGAKCAVLTPTDIYVTPNGDFRLGSLPQRPPEKSDRFSHLVQLYTAPEAYEKLDGDGPAIFALGTIMYKLLNGGLEPFRNALDFDSAASAYKLRISGIRLSAPVNADALLSAIILKACEYNPDRRYIYAEDMLEELMLLADGNYQRRPRPVRAEPLPENEEVRKLHFAGIGIGAGIVVLAILVFCLNLKFNDTYVRAERYMRDGKIEKAVEMFNDISWYKDSDKMLSKCDFLKAEGYLDDGKTDKAIKIFEELTAMDYEGAKDALNKALLVKVGELTKQGETEQAMKLLESIDGQNDESDKLIKEQKHQTAMDLYIDGNYKEAKEIFLAIDQRDMAQECEYCIALDYKKDSQYTRAMASFNSLDGYNDSNEQFTECEEWLLNKNKEEDSFKSVKKMEGRFSDEDGYYVEYTIDGDELGSKYSLPFEEGEYFRLKDGIHYHSNDGKYWEKQWIYESASDGEILAYNYIDGKVYVLSKE